MFYNLCLLIFLREPLYGVYSLGVIGAIGLCAVIDGTTFMGLIPESLDVKKILIRINSVAIIALNMAFVWMSLIHQKCHQSCLKAFKL